MEMAEEAPKAAPKATKPKAPKKPAEHPGFKAMIVDAIAQLKEVSAVAAA